FSDTNGNYVMAVLASGNSWNSSISSSDNPALSEYIISSGVGDTTFSAGQVVQQNFTAIKSTAQISGHLQDNLNNPLAGVSINANASIGPISYSTSGFTDNSGNYLLPVANGNWSVFVNCCGNEGLDSYGLYD